MPTSPDGSRVSSTSRAADRTVVALTPPVAEVARRMSSQLGDVGTAEVVRRGLILLEFLLNLTDEEELVVRNTKTDHCEALLFAWDSS